MIGVKEKLVIMSKKFGFSLFETSAKNGIGFKLVINDIINNILKNNSCTFLSF